jgi:hypothetical protein
MLSPLLLGDLCGLRVKLSIPQLSITTPGESSLQTYSSRPFYDLAILPHNQRKIKCPVLLANIFGGSQHGTFCPEYKKGLFFGLGPGGFANLGCHAGNSALRRS